MNAREPSSKLPIVADQSLPEPASEPINYRYRRKATVVVNLGKGKTVRLEAYGARLRDPISLDN